MFRFSISIFALLLLFNSESHAVPKKLKNSKRNSFVTVKVIAMERNSKAPVYRGPVSIIGFSRTQKGETDANGVFQAEFPGNDTVAASIQGAIGYRDTSTKSVSIKNKNITFYLKMRRNNKQEPLQPPKEHQQPPPPASTHIPPIAPTPHPQFPNQPTPLPTSTPGIPPMIIQHPLSYYSLRTGEGVTLSVTATGTGNIKYQWMLNGSAIPNANSSIYNFTPEYTPSFSSRHVRINCIVTNESGSAESSYAIIAIAPTVYVYLKLNDDKISQVG